MPLNHLEIDQLLAEADLSGLFVRRVRQSDYRTLLLELSGAGARGRTLVLAMAPANPLFFLSTDPPPPMKPSPRFAEMLRSRVRGGRIREATQPGGDRIVRIRIDRGGDAVNLYVRLWTNAANVLAVDDESVILDAMFRRPQRAEVSGERWSLPEARPAPRVFAVREHPESALMPVIETEWRAELAPPDDGQQLREALGALIDETTDAIRRAELRLERMPDPQELKALADGIMAWGWQGSFDGGWFTYSDETDGSTRRLETRGAESVPALAERYYLQAGRARRARQHAEEHLQLLRRRASTLWTEMEALESGSPLSPEREAELRRPARTSGPDRSPGLRFGSHGYELIVGRTAKENDALLRNTVRGNDWWFHVRDRPGGYVFIRHQPGHPPSLEVMKDAALLAVHYSKARGEASSDCFYTQVKYLRRAKHGVTGTVIPTLDRNFTVSADPRRLEELLGSLTSP